MASQPEPPRCFAFARHPRVSEQVWSGSIGYPGAGEYLEFHRKHGERGLRYHQVTDNKTPLGDKQPYYPDDIRAKLYEHAQHFCNVVRDVARRATSTTPAGRACASRRSTPSCSATGGSRARSSCATSSSRSTSDPQVKLLTAEEALRPATRRTR